MPSEFHSPGCVQTGCKTRTRASRQRIHWLQAEGNGLCDHQAPRLSVEEEAEAWTPRFEGHPPQGLTEEDWGLDPWVRGRKCVTFS